MPINQYDLTRAAFAIERQYESVGRQPLTQRERSTFMELSLILRNADFSAAAIPAARLSGYLFGKIAHTDDKLYLRELREIQEAIFSIRDSMNYRDTQTAKR